MNVSVYYRSPLDKLCQIEVTAVMNHEQAIELVTAELKGDVLARKPFLALIMGGKK